MKTVITYGTYDLFHQGHYNMLKRAKEEGDYLIVGVTGDRYDVGRGKLSVKDSLATRIENVRKTGFADKIIIEEYLGQKISDIIKYRVDTFVIGDDWRGKFDHLNNFCKVKYISRTKGISSTQLREEKFDIYTIGVITDKLTDNQIVNEANYLTGFDVGEIFAEDIKTAEAFRRKYGLKSAANNIEDVFSSSDVLYVRTDISTRYDYIKQSLYANKHVLCDFPFSLESKKQHELWDLAKSKQLILLDNVKAPYSQVFTQLIWMVQGGLIGDVIDFNCSVSKQDMGVPHLFYELAGMAIVPMLKVLGHDYEEMRHRLIYENGSIEFAAMYFDYGHSRAKISVGNKIRVENQIEIIGTKGTIRMNNNWWKADYFRLERTDGTGQVFNMNFEGNGFRFLLSNMLDMINNDVTETQFFSGKDSIKVTEILENLITAKQTDGEKLCII